jgi:hypothetical protein
MFRRKLLPPFSESKTNKSKGATRKQNIPVSACLVYSPIFKMEAKYFSETSVDFQRTARYYIKECRIVPSHRCENLNSNRNKFVYKLAFNQLKNIFLKYLLRVCVLKHGWQHRSCSVSYGINMIEFLHVFDFKYPRKTEGVAWSAQRIPTAVNLGFLERSRYFAFK